MAMKTYKFLHKDLRDKQQYCLLIDAKNIHHATRDFIKALYEIYKDNSLYHVMSDVDIIE